MSEMKVLFSDKDQSVVRRAFSDSDSSKYPEPRKKGKDPDPLSTLVYECEHASGIERLAILAKGLTDIKQNFTEDDVEELFPGEGGKLMKQMIASDTVIEVSHGRFKAV